MTASQPKPKLTLINGTPVTIALQYPTGKIVPSRIPGAPNQVYYTLTDGRGMYLPLEVGPIIDALKLRAGEPFTLVKRSPRDWGAARVEKERDFHPPLPIQGDYNPPPGPVNGAGEDAGAILGRCYSRAIDIALKAVETARTKGLMVTPSFEDLRCISTALMISETGRR
jgi:hypothetical protein